MKPLFTFGSCLLLCLACSQPGSHQYNRVEVTVLYTDTVSIRALELMPGALAMAGSQGFFGSMDLSDHRFRTGRQAYGDSWPEFRAVAHTASDFFMLSAGDPALLYKTGDSGGMELVYQETGPEVFYDAMAFWDNQEGIAVGDTQGGCLSILITRNGGQTWEKQPCAGLPAALEGEGAFAASNTNIAIQGDSCWMVTTKGRVFRSEDRGRTWEVFSTPAQATLPSQGLYSLAFYDAQNGIAIGGDYSEPEGMVGNKVVTTDGGVTWQRVADGVPPGYKSCIRYVPGSGGEDIVAVGFTGISYSGDGGYTWRELSTESFYTLQFLNDSIAYAAGRGRVAKLVFSK